jgi:SAM-dependent methyltransferase
MGAYNKTGDNRKAAIMNGVFYDLAAKVYEKADGKRGSVPEYMIRRIMGGSKDLLIDVGAGTGYASKVAADKYRHVYAMDISGKMLNEITDKRIHKFQCDVTERWPFHETVKANKIISISTLHHIPDPLPMLAEADLHLKVGGIFYSDLDIDETFVKVWRPLLKIYRGLKKAGKRFADMQPAVTEELYHDIEVHADGIKTDEILSFLEMGGYTVDVIYHWGNGIGFPKGLAPYVMIWAEKEQTSKLIRGEKDEFAL